MSSSENSYLDPEEAALLEKLDKAEYFEFEFSFNNAKSKERVRSKGGYDAIVAVAKRMMEKQKEEALRTYGSIPAVRNASQSVSVFIIHTAHAGESEDQMRAGGAIETTEYVMNVHP